METLNGMIDEATNGRTQQSLSAAVCSDTWRALRALLPLAVCSDTWRALRALLPFESLWNLEEGVEDILPVSTLPVSTLCYEAWMVTDDCTLSAAWDLCEGPH